MMKKKMQTMLAVAVAASLTFTTGCASGGTEPKNTDTAATTEASGEGETLPVSLGRQTLQNVTFPEGDSYEDNAYVRMTDKDLNIAITDEFEANGEDYDRQVSLALSAGELPDMMKIGSLDTLKELYENDLIADLTDVYEEYASDYIKSLYDSYNGRALANVTIDGKIMALPGTSGDNGPSIAWIRGDWMEELGLNIDEDGDGCIKVEDLETVAKTFMEKNPAGVDNVVGIAFAPWLTSGDPDGTYSMNSIAYALGAFPKTWMEKDGSVVYGSTTEEMKQALTVVSGWFQDGILDPQVGTRTWDDITALMTNGQCGIAFGTWHIPGWLLNSVYALNDQATFEPYVVEDADGMINCKHNDATSGYIVVRKDFSHPELAIQIANLFYDTLVNDKTLLETYPEVNDYVTNGMDGSARPFNIEINSYTSLLDDYTEMMKGINNELALEDVSTLETRTNIPAIQRFLEGDVDADNWTRYYCRVKGVGLLQSVTENDRFAWITPIFPETTSTMETNWANLEKLEEETFIKIVTGEVDVETGFEQFVSDWYAQGGTQIIKEISEQLQ